MSLTGSSTAEKIWNYLYNEIGNAYGVAGLMGNLYAESGLKSTNLQNSYESKLGYTDTTYTNAVDDGTYTAFATDSAGYGLAQWTYKTRKANMLAYHQGKSKSIGDLETQLGFLVKELSGSYGSVYKVLKNAASVKEASDEVLTGFERPADQSDSAKTKRAGYGQKYYDSYAGTSTATSTSSSTSSTSSSTSYAVGSTVTFCGTKHYTSANATTGKTATSGLAKITAISSGAKHPYHVIHTDSTSNVYGWVDAADIGASSTTSTTSTASSTSATKKTATDKAKAYLKSLAGTYTATGNLNIRNGAGTGKSIMVTIPKGTSVKNYGYYTAVSGVKWLYIQFTYNDVTYTGFASSKYLKKS